VGRKPIVALVMYKRRRTQSRKERKLELKRRIRGENRRKGLGQLQKRKEKDLPERARSTTDNVRVREIIKKRGRDFQGVGPRSKGGKRKQTPGEDNDGERAA